MGGARSVTARLTLPTPQIEPDEHCLFDFANCLRFRPNTRRKTLTIIAIQPDDTYTVWYWREKKDHTGEIIARSDGVYCDTLQTVVERLYDDYIRQHQQGWIHLD